MRLIDKTVSNNADKAYRRLRSLTADWVHINTWLPIPPPVEGYKPRQQAKAYGHPAEWASDTAAEIAEMLSSWHDLLAEQLNDPPPPATRSERTRVAAAWKYLSPRTQHLVKAVELDDLDEISELHHKIITTLGLTTAPQPLDIPCPNSSECENLFSLFREIRIGTDFIYCELCNYKIREDHYPWLVRCALDSVLDDEAQSTRLGRMSREAVMLILGRESTSLRDITRHLNAIRSDSNKPPIRNVRIILSRLVSQGFIERAGRGIYQPPTPAATFENAALPA